MRNVQGWQRICYNIDHYLATTKHTSPTKAKVYLTQFLLALVKQKVLGGFIWKETLIVGKLHKLSIIATYPSDHAQYVKTISFDLTDRSSVDDSNTIDNYDRAMRGI